MGINTDNIDKFMDALDMALELAEKESDDEKSRESCDDE